MANGVEAQADGKSISAPVELVSDEKPTEIRTGTQTFFLINREERFGIRLKDSNSETRRNFKGLHWFPVDESYKVKARLEPFSEPKELKVPNVLGGFFQLKSPGTLKFTLNGKECSLQPVEEKMERSSSSSLMGRTERDLQGRPFPLCGEGCQWRDDA